MSASGERDDDDEVRLREAWQRAQRAQLEAEHTYVGHLRSKGLPRFLSETEGFVFDQGHPRYVYVAPATGGSGVGSQFCTEADRRCCHQLFRRLSLACHPDKCSSFRAAQVFAAIHATYKADNLEALRRLAAQLDAGCPMEAWDLGVPASGSGEEHKTEAPHESGRDGSVDLAAELQRWKNEYWYLWQHAEKNLFGAVLHEVFVAPEVLAQREADRATRQETRDQLAEFVATMSRENAALRSDIDALRDRLRTSTSSATTVSFAGSDSATTPDVVPPPSVPSPTAPPRVDLNRGFRQGQTCPETT